jgi:uncharacterized membrane protein (UPF0127 family)
MGSVALAGCLDSTTSQSSTPTDATGSDDDTDSPASTPTETPAGSDGEGTDTPTPTPEETPTATETPTPTPEATPPPGDQDEEVFPDYEMTDVAVRSPESELLGWVRAAIADTRQKRFTGLSDTESLPPQYGMLFIFEDVGDRQFVMREMDFGIDIVYADAEGRITSIHHAPAPGPGEDGNDQEYPGRGKYVLEVNYDWTTDHGVDVGDELSNLAGEYTVRRNRW